MLSDREEISRGLAEGVELREIAARIGRDPSVVSREVARHGGRVGYRAGAADGGARVGRARPKALAVDRSPRLRAVVTKLLRDGWSPGSVAGRLPVDFPAEDALRVSHEAVYTWVYAQPVSTLARELLALRSGRTARRGGRRPPPAPRIREPRYIEERPAEAEGRHVPGHWEGDLVIGKGGRTAVATLVERTSRFLVLVPLTARDSTTVSTAVIAAVGALPAHVKRSLTWDCGAEMPPPRRHHRHRSAGLLRPPPLPVGARQQREPQPHRPRVLPEERRHHRRPELPRRRRRRDQRPTP